jgi:hypothetical protein
MIRQSHVAESGWSPGEEVKENYLSFLLLAASCSQVPCLLSVILQPSKPCRLEFWPKQGSNPAETM